MKYNADSSWDDSNFYISGLVLILRELQSAKIKYGLMTLIFKYSII